MRFWEFIGTVFERAFTSMQRGNPAKNWEAQRKREQYRAAEKQYYNNREEEKKEIQEWIERNNQWIDPKTGKVDIENAEFNYDVALILMDQNKISSNEFKRWHSSWKLNQIK